MAEEAKIRIVIDPSQARREIEKIQTELSRTGVSARPRGLPGPSQIPSPAEEGGGGFGTGLAAGAVAAPGRIGRFARGALGVLGRGLAVEQVAITGFPVLQELIRSGAESVIREFISPINQDFANTVSGFVQDSLNKITDTVQNIISEPRAIAAATKDSASLFGAALIAGQPKSNIVDDFTNARRLSKFQSKVRSDIQEGLVVDITEREAKNIRESWTKIIQDVFLPGSK